MSVSRTVSEIFNIKYWCDLKIGGWGRSRSLNIAPFDRSYTTYCWPAIVSIVLYCTIFELFNVNDIVTLKSGLEVNQGYWKWYHSKAWVWFPILYILRWPTNSKSYMIYRTASFQWPWTTPTSGFKVTPFFDAEYLGNDTRHKHSFNGILIWIDLHTPYSTVPFRMTLSDLAKYSMTRNVTRPLCDSWASCFMPLAFDAAVRGSLRNIAMIVWYGKKLELWGYLMVKKVWGCSVVLTEYRRVTDRRMDGQTA